MVWSTLSAGTAGWLLLAAGVGKVSDWSSFRRSLGDGRIVPERVQPVLAAVVPPLEIAFGLGSLVVPDRWTLIPAGILFGAFAAYQAEVLRRGNTAECGCYGRIRNVQSGPWTIVAYAVLAAAAIASGVVGRWEPVLLRTEGGAALAAAALLALGARRSERRSGFPYAEVYYMSQRLAGEPDGPARQALAREFGLGVAATYKLVPRSRALWLVLTARFKEKRQA